jgi:hypothetical protein
MKDKIPVDVQPIAPEAGAGPDLHDALRLTKTFFLLTKKEDRERVILLAEQLLARNLH